MYDDHTKHLRAEPIDHRLTVAVECGGRGVIPPTTDRLERTGCIPCLQKYFQRVGRKQHDGTALRCCVLGPSPGSTFEMAGGQQEQQHGISSALREGATPLELLPANAATLLTSMAGMVLVYVYLIELIGNGANTLTGNLMLVVYAASSSTLLMEGARLMAGGREETGKPPPGEGRAA